MIFLDIRDFIFRTIFLHIIIFYLRILIACVTYFWIRAIFANWLLLTKLDYTNGTICALLFYFR